MVHSSYHGIRKGRLIGKSIDSGDDHHRPDVSQARPLKEQSTAKSQQGAQWSQRVTDLMKTRPRDNQAIEKAEARVAELTREARDLAAKVKEIEDAVYDLKSVNPYKKTDVDDRTPEELMNIIEAKGREVAEVLATLRAGVAAKP